MGHLVVTMDMAADDQFTDGWISIRRTSASPFSNMQSSTNGTLTASG